jgi:hypothetical protein
MVTASEAYGLSLDRLPPRQRERVRVAAQSTLEVLGDWFGPAPVPQPALDGVPARWLVFERDRSLERAVIASVTRQYWSQSVGRDQLSPFEEAVVATVSRAIQERLETSTFEVVRFFGGGLPVPLLRSPPAGSQPRVWRIDESPADAEVLRMVRSLQTLERYIGWPAMAQTLAALRASGRRLDADGFAATVSDIRGTDMNGLVSECFRPDAVFDYAIEGIRVSPPRDTVVESSVSVVRRGSGVFEAGTDSDPEQSIPLLVRFADGRELRDWFDGRAASTTRVYTTNSRVIAAIIDPEMMLRLDADRANNSVTTVRSIRPLGLGLALQWMAWLQQMMLTYSALV